MCIQTHLDTHEPHCTSVTPKMNANNDITEQRNQICKKKKKIGVLDKTFYFNSSIEQIANYAENCIVVFPQGCSILV